MNSKVILNPIPFKNLSFWIENKNKLFALYIYFISDLFKFYFLSIAQKKILPLVLCKSCETSLCPQSALNSAQKSIQLVVWKIQKEALINLIFGNQSLFGQSCIYTSALLQNSFKDSD